MTKSIIVTGRDNQVLPGVTDLVALNCIGMTFGIEHNGQVWISNVKQFSTESATATGSAPITIDGSKMMYYCDDTGGNVTLNLGDPVKLENHSGITLKRTHSGGNNIVLNGFNGEKLEFVALPQNIIPNIGDAITIRTNGTDWFIISKA